jgi:hypothetical protein
MDSVIIRIMKENKVMSHLELVDQIKTHILVINTQMVFINRKMGLHLQYKQ